MKVLFILSALIPLFSFAQDRPAVNFDTQKDYYDKMDIQPQYLLADKVNLRECPSTDCKRIKVLSIGQPLLLLEKSGLDTIKGISSAWYKVKANQATGWLWGGLIAQRAFGSQADTNDKFVWGLEKIVDEGGWWSKHYQIRAFRNNVQIDKFVFQSFGEEIYEVKSLGNAGLKNLDDLITLEVPCTGGCGCSAGEIVIFWSGDKFRHIEKLIGTADAWASESVQFIYPTDMEGIEDVIIQVSSLYLDSTSEDKVKRALVREYFSWDGDKLVSDGNRKTERKEYWTKQ